MMSEDTKKMTISTGLIAATIGLIATLVYDRINLGSMIANHDVRLVELEKYIQQHQTTDKEIAERLEEIGLKIQILNDKQQIFNERVVREVRKIQ